jgi:PHD/YefM family antitoxin component YafN of YafNO toxin-antitoxin module
MGGIQFVIDDKGNKSAVIIDLNKYSDLWEDFYDCLVARQRRKEIRESLNSVKKRLQRAGKLNG